jgi:alpha-L-fucosidase
MKTNSLFLIILFLSIACSESHKNGNSIVTPTDRQAEWADAEIGVLIHFDMPVFKPDYNFREFGSHPDPKIFNPTDLNTDQWLATAKNLGAKYAILVAKHCSGFCLWPTKSYDYSIKNSPWKNGKGDIVHDFVQSCKKYDIKPGIYASTSANGYCYVDNPGIVKENSPITQQEYNKIVETQLTELWSNYGDLFEVWFDGGVLSVGKGGPDILSLLNRLQPNTIAFQGPFGFPHLIRWVGNEEGTAPYPCWATCDSTTLVDGGVVFTDLHGDPYAPFWCPGESDFPLRWNTSFQGGWFWHEGEDSMIYSVNELMHKYETSVGRNTNMLLGIVINDKGLVPATDVERINEYGKEINKQYASPYKQTSGKGFKLTINFDNPTSIDRVVIQEDIKICFVIKKMIHLLGL